MATHYSSCVNDSEDEGCPSKYPDVEIDNTNSGRKASTVGKKRKRKDPNAPKRAATAYMIWLNSNRQNIINDHFTSEGECTLEGREKVTKVATKAGELWRGMDEVSKKPFESKAADAKAEYETAMSEYTPEKKIPDAPDGWIGPVHNTFIRKLSQRKGYTSFNAAVSRARELGPAVCGGITKNHKDGRYSLRNPGEPEDGTGKDAEGDTSWVFNSGR